MKKISIVVLTMLDVFVFAVFALINLNGTYKDNQKKIADNRQKTEQIKAKTDSLSGRTTWTLLQSVWERSI